MMKGRRKVVVRKKKCSVSFFISYFFGKILLFISLNLIVNFNVLILSLRLSKLYESTPKTYSKKCATYNFM
jgi:hypothetical protein